ncbi:MAG: magnesium transporter [Candidatus Latescibacterota bacterium]
MNGKSRQRPIEGAQERIGRIQEMIERQESAPLLAVLCDLHPADVADLVEHLKEEEADYLFGLLDHAVASEVLVEMDEHAREHLFAAIGAEKLAQIVDRMESNEAAEVVAALSDELAERVLKSIGEEDSEDVKELLGHEEDTAGRLMAMEIVSVHEDATVAEAISAIRRAADQIEAFYNVYVVDSGGCLVGVLPLASLLRSRSDRMVADIMERDVMRVQEGMDQEDVARMVQKYDLVSVPVVDEMDRLVGRITIDDIVDVVVAEASEDIRHMAGTGDESIREDSAFRIAGVRLPWILISLIGGVLSGSVIGMFRGTLSSFLPLAIFIPIITAMGGNIGIQSAALTVRGLALGEIDAYEIWKRIFRELRVGVVMGVVCGGSVGLIALFWESNAALGIVVGVAMFAAIAVATTMGTFAPIVFRRLGIDPAIATGPFVTMSNDIIGLIIYFGIATAMRNWLVP